jgi:hypothetical protein
MYSHDIQRKFDRFGAWLDRQNELHDTAQRERPAIWHAGKVALGAVMFAKAMSLGMHATVSAQYAFAVVFLLGGAALAIEGIQVLRYRLSARS